MDDLLRQLSLGGISARLAAAAAVTGLAAAAVALALGLRRAASPGRPQPALVVAVLLGLPLTVVLAGMAAAPVTVAPGDDPAWTVSLLRESLAARRVAGWAGLILALPLGAATGLWAGIAAARRTRRAGERARLAAIAAGEGPAGQAVAAALDRSHLPQVGAGIGLFAGLAGAALPAIGLLLSTAVLEAALVDLVHLEAFAAPVLLHAAATQAGRSLVAFALAGAGGLLVAGTLAGVLVHAASSRRGSLAVARRVLASIGAGPAATAAIDGALAATGRPRALGPTLLAVALLVLAVVALALAASLEAPMPDAGAIAALVR